MKRAILASLFLIAACSNSPFSGQGEKVGGPGASLNPPAAESSQIDLGQKLPPAPIQIQNSPKNPNRGRLNVWLEAYDPCRKKPCPEEAPETEEDRRRYSVPYRR